MSGLDASLGQYAWPDGSAAQADDATWQEAIKTHNAQKTTKAQRRNTNNANRNISVFTQ